MRRPNISVPDHAVIRQLERVHGIDIEEIRTCIRSLVRADMDAGCTASIIGEFTYVLDPKELVVKTVINRSHRKRRSPRDFREAGE